jgi:hypothetical protein
VQAVEALRDLARAAAVDAERGAATRIEVHAGRGVEGAPLGLEIAAITGEHEVLPADAAALRGEDALALHGGGDEGHFRHAALLHAGEHQPGVTRFQGQGGHRAAFIGELPAGVQGTQIVEQGFCAAEAFLERGIEPTELPHFADACRLEKQHHFGEVHAPDLRGIEGLAPGMLAFAPETEGAAGTGASGTACPLLG